MTMKQFKFCWKNPTAHWRLNLGNKHERAIMMQLIAINNSEADFSKNHSGRGDTSQQGNWNNFRNERYTIDKETKEMSIDKDFIRNLPGAGYLEFDYVSTARPSPYEFIDDNTTTAATSVAAPTEGLSITLPSISNDDAAFGTISGAIVTAAESGEDGVGMMPDTSKPVTPMTGSAMQTPFTPNSRSKQASRATPRHHGGSRQISSSGAGVGIVPHLIVANDDLLFQFMQQLGLSNRSKVPSTATLYVLLDLQLASTKYYFLVQHIVQILEAFEDHWDVQARVVVALFSRIRDLHNMDILMRGLQAKAQQEIIKRVGILNVINPLKIAFDFVFSLKYLDNRVMMVALMELASFESADQIVEDATTELPISTMYGSYNRALNETRPETMRFAYCDFGVRTNNVRWDNRRDLLRKFLVGTHPIDEEVYKVITMFKELETHEALTTGPIDMQYANYLKSKKSNRERVTKSAKNMVGLMQKFASTRKSM